MIKIGKAEKDGLYARWVDDGQRRDFLDDVIEGVTGSPSSIYSKGIKRGQRIDMIRAIWSGVYKDIGHAVSLVLSDDFRRAFEHYKEMTLKLKKGR